jgi:hypothetical protein
MIFDGAMAFEEKTLKVSHLLAQDSLVIEDLVYGGTNIHAFSRRDFGWVLNWRIWNTRNIEETFDAFTRKSGTTSLTFLGRRKSYLGGLNS